MAGEILVQSSTYRDSSPRLSKLSMITPAGGTPSLVIPNRKNGIMSAYEMQAVVAGFLPANSANSYINIREGRDASTSITTLPESMKDNLYWMNLSWYIDTLLCGPDETPSQDLRARQGERIRERIFELYQQYLVYPGLNLYKYATSPISWAFVDGKGLQTRPVRAWSQNLKYQEGFSIYETTNVGKWGGVYGVAEFDSGYLNTSGGESLNPRIMIFPGIAAGTVVECLVYYPTLYVRVEPLPLHFPMTNWFPSIIGMAVKGELTGNWPNLNSVIFDKTVACSLVYDPGLVDYYTFSQTSTYRWVAYGCTQRIRFTVPESRMLAFIARARDPKLFWEEYAVTKFDSKGNYILADLEMQTGEPEVVIDRIYTP